MSENILVTGGAGFIGSHLMDALIDAGYRVRVFDNLEAQVHGGLREEERWPEYANPEAEYVLGDVRDREALRQAMTGIDAILHQAAMVGVGQSMYQIARYVDVNINGTANLLDILVNEATIRERVRKLVVASSMSNYGEGMYRCMEHGEVFPGLRDEAQLKRQAWELFCPHCGRELQPEPTGESKPMEATSIYAISKKTQEEMVLATGRAYGIPSVALRYFNTYGPRQALSNPYTGVAAIFSGRLLNNKPPVIYEDGRQRRDFVHVSDVVQANLIALQRAEADYQAFNVGTGRALTVLDVAEALAEHLGYAGESEIVARYRAGDIRHCYADIERMENLGYRPQVRFEDGIAELVSWVRAQTAADDFDKARQELEARGLAV